MEKQPDNHLILVPTQFELDILSRELSLDSSSLNIHLCGFGPIAAAARSAELICKHQPNRVCLIGIAGALENTVCQIGEAYTFDSVLLDGVGAMEGTRLLLPSQLGFPQWTGDQGTIFEEIQTHQAERSAGQLLTVSAASGSFADADRRKETFPGAIAEDMEGFGVAIACAMQGIPLTIIRGISNRAGDRDHNNWQIDAALKATVPLLAGWLEHS